MDFEQITRFAILAKHLNMTKAADELHTTQPNLSKHLKTLEDALSGQLFKRHAKGLKLTDKGREFLSDLEPLITQWQWINVRYLNNGTVKAPAARLNIAGVNGAAASFLPAPLALFGKTYPEVEVTVRSNVTANLEGMILAGEVELALCPVLPDSPLLTREPYRTSKLVLFVAKDDPLCKKKTLTLADIAKRPLVIRSGAEKKGGTATLLKRFSECGNVPKIALRSDQPEAIKEAVRRRSGIGVLYYATIESALKHGAFKALKVRDLDIEGQFYIVYHKTRPLSAHALEFLRLLRKQCERRNRGGRRTSLFFNP